MAQLFSNNAVGTLLNTITASATSITLLTGEGDRFHAPVDPDFELVTLDDGNNEEIVKVTARSGDTLTVVRAQEGTTASSFVCGATVEGRLTAGTLDRFETGVGGGGGGTTSTGNILGIHAFAGGWGDTPPQSVQLAATPIADTGVSYVAGDVFLAEIQESLNIGVHVCVALKNFTFDKTKGLYYHWYAGDLWRADDLGLVFDSGTLPFTLNNLLTSTTMSVVGSSILVDDVTFTSVTVNNITAGTPVPLTLDEGFTPIPWLIGAMPGGVLMYDDSADLGHPQRLQPGRNCSGGRDKTDTRWSSFTSIGFGRSYYEIGSDWCGPFLTAGFSYTVPELERFFATPPSAGSPVYYIGTGTEMMSGSVFDTTPGANSIRIGTWGSGSVLTVAIS